MKKKAGFTLSELLVVLAIIAVVSALLMPVFLRVREKGRQSICQNNLRQIGISIQQYVQDNDNTYFPAVAIDLFTINKHFEGFSGYLPVYKEARVKQEDGSYVNVADHLIPALSCPTHPDYLRQEGRFTSYFFNFLSEPGTPFEIPSTDAEYERVFPRAIQESTLTSESSTWMVREQQTNTTDYMDEVKSSCGRTTRWNTRHSGGSNYLFFDGHVKWFAPKQMGEYDCKGSEVSFVTNP